MWQPYILSVRAHIPDPDSKIVFDRYHVMGYLGTAVDTVRKREHRALAKAGDTTWPARSTYGCTQPRTCPSATSSGSPPCAPSTSRPAAPGQSKRRVAGRLRRQFHPSVLCQLSDTVASGTPHAAGLTFPVTRAPIRRAISFPAAHPTAQPWRGCPQFLGRR
jgi:hypothetical protein